MGQIVWYRMLMGVWLGLGLYSGAAIAQGDAVEQALKGPATLRIGVVRFDTVNWELEVIKDMGLAEERGVRVELTSLDQNNATTAVLQAGAVDIIVTDWLWVSRQRSEGQDYTFVPQSRSIGRVMVRPDAGIGDLEDLRGKRLGVAGGPMNVSWLLLRAYAQQAMGQDLAEIVEPVFGEPPLLSELMLAGELPAVLNAWDYSARLKADGMRELLHMRDVLSALGVSSELPMLGWVFHESWGNQNRRAVEGFLEASHKAKNIMLASDAIWDLLEDQVQATDQATLVALRNGYREGIVESFGELERSAAAKMLDILAPIGGPPLVGSAAELAPGTFWADELGRPYQIVPYGMPAELVNPELLYQDQPPAVSPEPVEEQDVPAPEVDAATP